MTILKDQYLFKNGNVKLLLYDDEVSVGKYLEDSPLIVLIQFFSTGLNLTAEVFFYLHDYFR